MSAFVSCDQRWRQTRQGDTLPPTGKKVIISGVTVQEVKDDKVVRQTFYFDNAEFLQQLGLMPAMEGAATA